MAQYFRSMNSRRDLVKGISSLPFVSFAGGQPAQPTKKPYVAIQIGARSFVDEGVDACLDTLQEEGGVNTLIPTVFTYGTGSEGRQTSGQPLLDHGVQAYDEIHGGSYTKVHPECYTNSAIKDIRAP